MKNKYLIFDLDGTLLDGKSKELFPGVPKLLKDLSSDDFLLYISSRSDDLVLRESLKKAGVYDYFDAVMGSSVLEKSTKHIETFDMCSADNNFIQKAVMIGDGEIDASIAEEYGIPFVKIGKTGEYRYEIDSVLEIEECIKRVK